MGGMERLQLVKGPYLGDVTALCFVRLSSEARFPALLAGTGAQVESYDLHTGERHFSYRAFDGVRVHGIQCLEAGSSDRGFLATVAVHGERRVKLFRMKYSSDGRRISFELWQAIPRLTKWVLDVRILQGCASDELLVVIGLSDNSVSVWKSTSHFSRPIYHAHCSVKCLLYSMRLWGDSLETIRVAAGTIFNEVLVWMLTRPEFENKSTSHEIEPAKTFRGHEGSIYRITWSQDGNLLASASDDRSARIWNIDGTFSKPALVLFGHSARVWDICVDAKVLVTASEDCSCGVWSPDGVLLDRLRGHTGRGIWRCSYDSQTAVLVTAGADASMKLYSLSEWVSGAGNRRKEMDLFQIPGSKIEGSRDSKSEYVRCLHLSGPASIYIGTNHGLLRHVHLATPEKLDCSALLVSSNRCPIVCVDVIPEENYELVAIGDDQGYVTILEVSKEPNQSVSTLRCKWAAETERQLLGLFWCKSLGSSFIFTTDPKGGVRCWLVSKHEHARLSAYYKSSLSSRIVCLDVCPQNQFFVCGDQRGNLVSFAFRGKTSEAVDVEASHFFRGAHGISAVASVTISDYSHGHFEIVSTGRDGCICKLAYESSSGFSCTALEKVAAITVVEGIIDYGKDAGSKRRVAAGFAASDFLLWDLTNEVELRRTSCGGWRRPHSFFVGESPEAQYCFAYLKDQVVNVCRSWVSRNQRTGLQCLQRQSHGKEIHAVSFMDSDWVVSGSEDGTVQITRYSEGVQERLTVSTTLEEQAGGGAVRAVSVLSSVHTMDESLSQCPRLLFSAGAKEALTCWRLQNMAEDGSVVTAKWLSTHTTYSKKTTNRDDLRVLAFTVFAVQLTSTSSLICFLVTAMSNATLSVKAFDMTNGGWYHNLAVLHHHKAPILSLHHASTVQGTRRTFLAFSGSSDGETAVWNLTALVSDFTSKLEKLESRVAGHIRPRCGRGSEGGKRHNYYHSLRASSNGQGATELPQRSEQSITAEDHAAAATLHPAFLLPRRHQSGVNCLYVSALSPSTVCIVSGGDDQALHFTVLQDSQDGFSVPNSQTIMNAHASALKGVWTDGDWTFSTGLDQRLRSWHRKDHKWLEVSNCIIDVPEAAALDAHSVRKGDEKVYRVAVVGRGLQIVHLSCGPLNHVQ